MQKFSRRLDQIMISGCGLSLRGCLDFKLAFEGLLKSKHKKSKQNGKKKQRSMAASLESSKFFQEFSGVTRGVAKAAGVAIVCAMW